MKRAVISITLALALGSAPAFAEVNQCPKGQSLKDNQCECDDPNTVKKDDGTCGPIVPLPGGQLPVGQATNIVFLAPLLAGTVAGVAALAGGGGGGGNATGTTSSTTGGGS
ncbi:hypothetical protein CKO11_10585 [Rhodobacter sp. TJ_12]|uniref:hypothetical protein n=1 Tax=Rhodobacter sp. TJ_12 TaxID=2029399 RepID=UPI001CC16971|nr:hypothetical protein [Rhodobacter sp. TJ_12]MBZ4022906.1 hypothetical protein [Rhodobacter sp. TJ_12]